MRVTLATLLLSAGMFILADGAAAQRWCAISNQGSTNCGFTTVDQCRSEVSGTGGSCMPEAPVGHLQPRAANARPAPKDEKLDALLERVNKKSDSLILCRGC
jgi:hypothetical protein